jgi:hypothetical protein
MMPSWFPWIFIGGIIFIVLGFVASKYKDKPYKNIQFLQDFISGSILIAFTGVLMPDIFPKIDIPVPISSGLSNIVGTTSGGGGDADFDLQVGPPRLAGR